MSKVTLRFKQLYRLIKQWFISRRELNQEKTREKFIKNEENLRISSLRLLAEFFPLMVLELYDEAIYQYKLSNNKTHLHNQAVLEIRAILEREMKKKYKENKILKKKYETNNKD